MSKPDKIASTAIFLIDNLPSGPALAAALGAVPLDADANPATSAETLWRGDARLLVHVNPGPRRSQRRGLELVWRLWSHRPASRGGEEGEKNG